LEITALEDPALSDLLVIEFPSGEKKWGAWPIYSSRLQREYLIELGDAVIAIEKPAGASNGTSSYSWSRVARFQGCRWRVYGRQPWELEADPRAKVTPTLVKER
jgi:hypothetical protein